MVFREVPKAVLPHTARRMKMPGRCCIHTKVYLRIWQVLQQSGEAVSTEKALADLGPKANETQQHHLIVRHDLLDSNKAGCHHALKARKLFIPAMPAQHLHTVRGGVGQMVMSDSIGQAPYRRSPDFSE